MKRRQVAFLTTLLTLVGTAGASASESTAERWRRELNDTRSLLLDAEWQNAQTESRRLLEELMADLKGGPGSAELVAVALAQLALAEAGLGRREEALWQLDSAEIFNPALGRQELAEFGIAGARLVEWRRAPTRRSEGPPLVLGTRVEGFSPPRISAGNYIVLRASAEQLRLLDPQLEASFVIDERGTTSEPLLRGRLDNPAPILLSLDVLREFRFRPATFRGKAVATVWNVPLPLTQGALRQALWDLKRSWIESLLRNARWQAAVDEAGALSRALAGATGPGAAEKQTIVAYYLSQARAGLAGSQTDP